MEQVFTIGEVVEWLRFPSSGSWYNARVSLYDPSKGYQVRVPGLDAVAEEWVDASRLRPRKRAADAARSPASARSVPGGGGDTSPTVRQMRLRQEKRRAAAAAQGRPTSSSSSVSGPEASPLLARPEWAREAVSPVGSSASEGEPPSPTQQPPPPPARRRPEASPAALARPLEPAASLAFAQTTPRGLGSTVSEQQWLQDEAQGGWQQLGGGDLNLRSLKLGHRELTRRLESMERLCNQEREARLELEAELREHRQLIKQAQVTAAQEREDAGATRAVVSALETTSGELARVVPQLRRDVDEQREAHDQFAEALMEAVEECVSKDTLIDEQEKVAAKMTEYWDRELGATASQAELQENRKLVEEQLQRGMQALLMHVEQVGSDFSVDVERLEEKTKHAQANTLKLQQSVEKSQGTLAGLVQESEEQIYQQLGPMSERVERMLERQDRMEAGSADALRVVADIGDRVGGVEAELHTRLDSELLYTKRKVEQTHELLSSRIDDEVLVLSERVEHLRQGTATIDSGLCRLDSKLDQTAEALNTRLEHDARKLDDQIFSVSTQVDGALVVMSGRLDTLTTDVQQFVVDSMLERELCRAAQTSLNQKINAAVAKLLQDQRRGIEDCAKQVSAGAEQIKSWTAERLAGPELRLADIEGKAMSELRQSVSGLEERHAGKLDALETSRDHQATILRELKDGTIGELKDVIAKTEAATKAGIEECKDILEAQSSELRDKMDGPNGVKKNFQDLIDAFRRRLEEKTAELYADLDTLDSSVHRNIKESNEAMSRKVDKDVSQKLKRMDEQLKLASEAKVIAQQTRTNLQMRFDMLEMGLDGRECTLWELMDGVQQLDARLEDVEENVTMLDIEAALNEATNEAMGDATKMAQDLDGFQSSLM